MLAALQAKQQAIPVGMAGVSPSVTNLPSIDSTQQLLEARNDPNTLQNLLSGGVGLQGLDPKFFKDPRHNYTTQIGFDPSQGKIEADQATMPLVLFHIPKTRWGTGYSGYSEDIIDTAPVGVHSTLAEDLSDKRLAKSLTFKGPHPNLVAAAKQIQGKSTIWTPAMTRRLRAWITNQRQDIQDTY